MGVSVWKTLSSESGVDWLAPMAVGVCAAGGGLAEGVDGVQLHAGPARRDDRVRTRLTPEGRYRGPARVFQFAEGKYAIGTTVQSYCT